MTVVRAHESERRLATLLSNLPGMAYRCRNDKKWTMEFASEGCRRLTGYAPDDLLDNRVLSYADLIHPDDGRRVWEAVQSALGWRRPFEIEYRIRTVAGEERWVWEQGVGVFSTNGDVMALEGYITDVTPRKIMEEKLRASEEKYRHLFEMMSDALFLVDNQSGRILAANAAAAAMYGFTREELITMRNVDLSGEPEATRRVTIEEFDRVPIRRHRKRDGTSFAVEIFARNFNLCDQRVHIAAIRDISARLKAEEKLRESEERYRAMVETQSEMVCRWLPDTTLTFVNAAYRDFFGIDRERAAGRSWLDFVPQTARDDVRAFYLELARNPRVYSYEHQAVDGQGDLRWQQWVDSPIFDTQGRLVEFQSVGRDVTDRKRVEEALRESEEKYRLVSENIPVAVYSALPDEYSTNLLITSRIRDLTGYTSDEFMENSTLWSRILHPEDRERVHRALDAHRHEGSLLNVEYRIVTRAGEERWIHDRAVPAFDAAGRIARIDGFMEDVTERKRLENRLQQSQKMEAIGRLAGGVAHDFNNLLGVITGYTEIAQRTMAVTHPARRRLDQLLSAIDKAAVLTRQLLAFSRRQPLKPRVVGMNSIVTGVHGLLQRLIGEDIELRIEAGAGRDAVHADSAQIEQVLLNLCVNARDAMSKGGVLTLSTRNENMVESKACWGASILPGSYVVLDVKDTGCGMDDAIRPQIFEPFFTTKSEGKGTGLGLTIVYDVVTQSGGYVDVETRKGEGTTFRIYLPLCEDEASDEPDGAERTRPVKSVRGSEKILIVEDDGELREIIAESIEEHGYFVVTASHGDDALEKARRLEGGVDLLVTDVVMPLVGGRELADRLAAAHPRLRVLFMSGYTEDIEALRELVDRGVYFLEKPFSAQVLAESVRAALESPPYSEIAAPSIHEQAAGDSLTREED
ncbi:MAG: PAS domain S-box protein [Vicinamibacteria bacterium]|nr:PAS domain S-box protein [Vicinamibacteria bacterium]